VHGHDAGESEVVADAVALLEALADGVRGDHIVASSRSDIDEALALVEKVPPTAATAVDTSMQTDAYDPEALSLYLSAERDREAAAAALADARSREARGIETEFGVSDGSEEPGPTAPIDLDGWTPTASPGTATGPSTPPDDDVLAAPSTGEPTDDTNLHDAVDDEEDAARASRAALRRWGVDRDEA